MAKTTDLESENSWVYQLGCANQILGASGVGLFEGFENTEIIVAANCQTTYDGTSATTMNFK